MFMVIGKFEFGENDIVLANCDTKEEALEIANNADADDYSQMLGTLEDVKVYEAKEIS